MKRCKVCRKKPRIDRRVDSLRNVFCSEDCFEKFVEGPDHFDHPYIDEYESMRRIYEKWMMNYEVALYKSIFFRYPKKTDLIEGLDETLDPHWDYYRLEGQDGIFSSEIYHYMQQLVKLQETIRNWKPDNRKYEKRLKTLHVKQKDTPLQ